ncbi:glycosyltransferase family 2 protein [Methylomonas rivi]|uniref:Glycosyltransferase family 2 protein n=1 Tax=Methylomonas rivi TaxID=2952226 RepID=A0ABT1U866_9GAMM|nr:glycosyltransferase family 2 protein [Methylomonas sp. WSC-6]
MSYHPTDELIENVKALVQQVDEILIVDNGSGLEAKQLLDNLIKQHSKLNIVFLSENLGIAAALNIGVKKAKAAGHEWVITFDQDSQVTPFMIEAMLRVYETYPNKEKVASLSPRYMDVNSGEISGSHLRLPVNKTLPHAQAYEVLTSGNLIKSCVFDFVGYFDESLFIDYVDREFCWRCIHSSYSILQINDAILQHRIGFQKRCKFLWFHPSITNHSPLRRYYIARNAIYILKVYLIKRPLLVSIDLYKLLKVFIKVAIFENNKQIKIKAICLGLLDGFLGRMGKCKRTF